MTEAPSLKQLMSGSPYLNYLYSYPHKTAYRPFDRTHSLTNLWEQEDKTTLFLYLHIPFCEMRCGFCNLFTTTNPQVSLVTQYLDQLEQQAIQVDKAIGEYHFSNIAIGGGTPTYLTAKELQHLFHIATQRLNIDLSTTPIGIETSPATITEDRLMILKQYHVNRISLGIESFSVKDANAMGRPQKSKQVEHALDLIQQANFETLNIDLIYGGEGQTLSSWLDSVQQAMEWRATEIYLYPLYVRPLTGLGRKGQVSWDDQRLESYYAARETLLNSGYQQISMRMFRQQNTQQSGNGEYHCQEDGMVGLGCGARSYTKSVHYSSEYAVKRQSILGIIENYTQFSQQAFTQVNYGIELNQDEQQRRYILLSLLQCEGVIRLDYQQQFAGDILEHFPELCYLQEENLAVIDSQKITLNDNGIAYSDVIGTWFFSPEVRQKMESYRCR